MCTNPAAFNLSGTLAQSSVKNMRRAERSVAMGVQTILNNLMQSMGQTPPLLRFVLYELRCVTAVLFPTHELNAVKAMLLLRLLVPAIISPAEIGIKANVTAEALASLVTLSRIVQAVSNGLAPSEERQRELVCFASLIKENQSGLQAYLEAVSVPPAASDSALQAALAAMAQQHAPQETEALCNIYDYVRNETSTVSDFLRRQARLPEPMAEDVGVLSFTSFMTELLVRHVRAVPMQETNLGGLRIEKVKRSFVDHFRKRPQTASFQLKSA